MDAARKPEMTEMEYQMRNWYYFNWLSAGDHIVEQHIHNLDVSNWLKGQHPKEASGMGGRQVRTGKDYGEIFDHHAVEYTYPDETKMYSQCRHIDGCWSSVSEHAHGTKGRLTSAASPFRPTARAVEDQGAGRQRHGTTSTTTCFRRAAQGRRLQRGRQRRPRDDDRHHGRMATYTGKVIKWDEALNSTVDLSPAKYAFDADPR